MYDSGYDPDEYAHLYWQHTSDERLRHVIYVDGRLVDSWVDSAMGSRWEEIAREHDRERRPVQPPAPPEPTHVRLLRWLDGMVGGRATLLALDDAPDPAPEPPILRDAEVTERFHDAGEHLARVAADLYDDEVARVLESALATVCTEAPALATSHPANVLAGGIMWVVGSANGLFRHGVAQRDVQRRLWMTQQISTMGRRLVATLSGPDVHGEPRPARAPDLRGFANARLLTPSTRRELIGWRDLALEAEAQATR